MSVARAAGLAVLIGLVFGGLLFIAGDYGRMQVLRAKDFIMLKFAREERGNLLRANEDLANELKNLKSVHGRVLSYEQDLKQRVDELALVLNSAAALGVIDSAKAFPIEASGPRARYPLQASAPKAEREPVDALAAAASGSGGVGGAEIDCSADREACRTVAGFSEGDEERILFRNSSEVSDERLVGLMDRYIDVLRTLPLGLPGVGHVSSPFGYRVSPFGKNIRLHEGVDFSLSQGTFVYGTGDGVVKEVRRCKTYGLMVDIQHSDRVVTRYAHLSKTLVSEGEKVCRGEVVGLAGSTGHSTGPHLHYEIRIDNKPRNPMQFLQLAARLSRAL